MNTIAPISEKTSLMEKMRVTKKKTRTKMTMFLMFLMPRFSCTYLIEAHAAQLVQAGGKQEWLDQGLAAAPIKVQMVRMQMVIVVVEHLALTNLGGSHL